MELYSAYANPSAINQDFISIDGPGTYRSFDVGGVKFITFETGQYDLSTNAFPEILEYYDIHGDGTKKSAKFPSTQHTNVLNDWWISNLQGGNGVTDINGKSIAYYIGGAGGLPVLPTSYIYTKINSDDISNEVSKIHTDEIWDNNTGSLYTFYTQSLQSTTSKQYYYGVKKLSSDITTVFSVAFGHANGSGSYSGGGQTNDSPSKAIYSQYKLMCLEYGNKFTISGSVTDYIYVINFNRDTYKDKLDPGNWQLSLTELSGSTNLDINFGNELSVATGSTLYTLIDNSMDSDQIISEEYGDLNEYSVVNGTISNGIISDEEWGKVYPKLGIIVLDGRVLDSKLNFGTSTGSNIDGDNAYKLFTSISGSSIATTDRSTLYPFDARSSKTITKNHYFIHVESSQYNFSNNPTYASGTIGELTQQTFINNPITYVTSIGLYNDRHDLLAIGKFSQPIKKNFNEELHITLNLEY